ncbi:MAG TPA: DUF3710 domain-containing protein [Stackebrandtia sp.]|uniref:DUF3710 domain-containing protein n=1 Tax=Stackebrandtia sp. TaxID=2023065 RepID=UPI002D45FAC7|nr:DUF3710 domain-containing protein [Stackebrandtia sp.]HZE41847.1 DUF3710 domain-containing protein [Stackebrandtia sp.]
MFGRKRRRDEADGDAVDVVDESTETTGPYDVADVPDDDDTERLDLGSLRIPALPGLRVGVASDDEGNPRPEVIVSTEDSAVRFLACAAPRSEGIWDEVRVEIAKSIVEQGGTATEVDDGPYGVEMVAKQPAGQGDTMTIRFIGINGPRWFLRILVQGDLATDPEASSVLDECIRGVVVDRGTEAMPVREPLPITLTAEMVEQQRQHQEALAEQQTTAPAKGGGRSSGKKRKPSPKPRKR